MNGFRTCGLCNGVQPQTAVEHYAAMKKNETLSFAAK
jgi:hypothetical protein